MAENYIIEVVVDNNIWETIPDVEDMCRNIVRSTLASCGIKKAETIVLLSNDKKLKELNYNFRGKNKPTNVLSFPGSNLGGDIAIAYETLKKEAGKQGKKFEHHLAHLLVHGTLHLFGYDHEDDKDAKEMEKKEIMILKKLKIGNPYEEKKGE